MGHKQLELLCIVLFVYNGYYLNNGCYGLNPGCFFRKVSHTRGESGGTEVRLFRTEGGSVSSDMTLNHTRGESVDREMGPYVHLTEKQCVQHCAANLSLCRSVDYQVSVRKCYMYPGSTDVLLVRNRDYERFEYLCNEARGCRDRMISMRNNTIQKPNVLVPIPDVEDLNGCTHACLENDRCAGFVWVDSCEVTEQCLLATGPDSNPYFMHISVPLAEHTVYLRARCYNLYV